MFFLCDSVNHSVFAWALNYICLLSKHCLLLPAVIRHIAFHQTLPGLEENLCYHFKDKRLLQVRGFHRVLHRPHCFPILFLLQLSLTHPSYIIPPTSGQVYNSSCYCGIRRPKVTVETRDVPRRRPKSGLQGLLEALEPDGVETEAGLSL